MADSWLTITPTSGGSKTGTTSTILKITASQNTGAERTSTLVFQTSSGVSKTFTITQEVGAATYVAKINASTTIVAAGGSNRFGDNEEILIAQYLGDTWMTDINPFETGLLVSAVSDSDWLRVTGYGSGKVNYYVDSRGTTVGSDRTATVTFTFYNPDDKTKILTIDYPIVQQANSVEKETFIDFEFLPIDLSLVDPEPSIYINPYSCTMDTYARVKEVYSSGESAESLLSDTDCEHFVVLNNIVFKTSTDTTAASWERVSTGGIRLLASTAAVVQTTGITQITIPGYVDTWSATSWVWTIPAEVSDTGDTKTYTAYRLIPQIKEVEYYTCKMSSTYRWVPWDYSDAIAKVCGIGSKVQLGSSNLTMYLTTISSKTKTTISSTSSTNIQSSTIEDGLYNAVPWSLYVSLPTATSSTTSSLKYWFKLNGSVNCLISSTRTSYAAALKRYSTSNAYSTDGTCSLTESGTAYFTYLFSNLSTKVWYMNIGSDTHFTVYYSFNGAEYKQLTGLQGISTDTTHKCITFKVVANQTTSSGSTYISFSARSGTTNTLWTINISAAEVKKTIRSTGTLYIRDGNSSLEDNQWVGLLAETGSGNRYLLAYSQYENDGSSTYDLFTNSNLTVDVGGEPITDFIIGRCYESDDYTDEASYDVLNSSGVDNDTLVSRFLSEEDYENDNLYAEYYLSTDGSEQIQIDQGYIENDGEEVWVFGNSSDTPFIVEAQ